MASTVCPHQRRYGPITDELRTLAVETVAQLVAAGSGRIEAVTTVATGLQVHPNSVRNWIRAAHRTAATPPPDAAALAERRRRTLATMAARAAAHLSSPTPSQETHR